MNCGPARRRRPRPPGPEYAERIVVKAGGDLHFVKTSHVLWIEAQGDFVKVQTLEQPQLVRETLQSMEKKLDGSRFLRIHRSFLVNVQHIKRVAPALYGDHTVYMSDGSKLRLSRQFPQQAQDLHQAAAGGAELSPRVGGSR